MTRKDKASDTCKQRNYKSNGDIHGLNMDGGKPGGYKMTEIVRDVSDSDDHDETRRILDKLPVDGTEDSGKNMALTTFNISNYFLGTGLIGTIVFRIQISVD